MSSLLEFRDVYKTDEAEGVLYALLRERLYDPAINISHFDFPSYEDHMDFVKRRPYWLWYLIAIEDCWIGAVNVTSRNEIGIGLFRAHQGVGWGRKVLEKLLSEYSPRPAIASERQGHFVANINPENERSIKMFESLGFKLVQWTYRHES